MSALPDSWTILITTHAIAASYALVFGAVNLFRKPKGDTPHRIIGFTWLIAMYYVIITSFWITTLNPGHFSWIHGLSIFTFFTISIGLAAAIRHNIPAHKGYMRGSYFGLLGAFVGVVAFPQRLVPQTIMLQPLAIGLFVVVVAISSAFFVFATIQLFKKRATSAH